MAAVRAVYRPFEFADPHTRGEMYRMRTVNKRMTIREDVADLRCASVPRISRRGLC